MKVAALLVTTLGLAASAQAAEWNFYGSARVETFISDTDENGSSTTEYSQMLQENARIGAKVRVSDSLRARFEYGTKGSNANIRQIWGEWTFGSGSLLVGQTYTPIYNSYSSSVYDNGRGLEGYGVISASRKPMVRLKFGGFQVAAVSPASKVLTGTTASENNIPKLEMGYTMKFNSGSVKLVGGYNTYELDNKYDVDSYVVGIGGKVKFGAAFLAGSIYTGQNLGPYGFKNSPNDDPTISANNVVDNESMGFTLIAGYKFNDMVKVQAGYGYTESELDQANSKEDDASQYYLQAKLTLAPGVYIVPEIGFVDEGKDANGNQEEEVTYYGAKWQINF
ncbi:MAG: porin [Desulfobacterales bacterium]|nr:porin [Desulfobacterales bacterium]